MISTAHRLASLRRATRLNSTQRFIYVYKASPRFAPPRVAPLRNSSLRNDYATRSSLIFVILRISATARLPNFCWIIFKYRSLVKYLVNAASLNARTCPLVSVAVGKGVQSNECWEYPDHLSGRSPG